jgi:hypothetical protein
MSKSKMPGYVALVLDNPTQERLKAVAVHPHVHAHHVMIAFRPTKEVYHKYTQMIGRYLEFEVTSTVLDDKAQTFRVRGVPSENKHPHVTVSLDTGVLPAYSKELLDKPDRDERAWPGSYPFKGGGTVQFVRYHEQPRR